MPLPCSCSDVIDNTCTQFNTGDPQNFPTRCSVVDTKQALHLNQVRLAGDHLTGCWQRQYTNVICLRTDKARGSHVCLASRCTCRMSQPISYMLCVLAHTGPKQQLLGRNQRLRPFCVSDHHSLPGERVKSRKKMPALWACVIVFLCLVLVSPLESCLFVMHANVLQVYVFLRKKTARI